jgi:hypothetical protein
VTERGRKRREALRKTKEAPGTVKPVVLGLEGKPRKLREKGVHEGKVTRKGGKSSPQGGSTGGRGKRHGQRGSTGRKGKGRGAQQAYFGKGQGENKGHHKGKAGYHGGKGSQGGKGKKEYDPLQVQTGPRSQKPRGAKVDTSAWGWGPGKYRAQNRARKQEELKARFGARYKPRVNKIPSPRRVERLRKEGKQGYYTDLRTKALLRHGRPARGYK